MRRLILLSVICCLIPMFLGGCGSRTAADAKTKTIAVIPKGTTHEFWKSVHAGAQQAAKEFNLNIIWKGPLKEDDREQQIALVEGFISSGAAGIVLAPMDDTALRAPVVNSARLRCISDSCLLASFTALSSSPTFFAIASR